MTSRTTVSFRSKTDWIMRDSSDSMSELAAARSTSSRTSTSDANGPSRNPLPGVSALPSTISSRGSGPSSLVAPMTGRADASAIRSAFWRPRVRGPTPIST
jgi:hypothetical protein